MITKTHLAIAAVVSIGFVAPAQAVVISGELYNTGLDADGILAGSPAGVDGNWDVTPPGADAITYYNGAYAANDADSQWISSNSLGGDETSGPTDYTFTTTFDLTGYDASTAGIVGDWGVDNWATIYLNGSDTGVSLPFGTSSFTSLTGFALSSDFVSGVNTLTVRLTNAYPAPSQSDPGPMALRFDNLVLTADRQVPEPAALGLLGLGLFGIAAARRRRRT